METQKVYTENLKYISINNQFTMSAKRIKSQMQTPIIKIPKVLKTRFHNINTLDFLALEILI